MFKNVEGIPIVRS